MFSMIEDVERDRCQLLFFLFLKEMIQFFLLVGCREYFFLVLQVHQVVIGVCRWIVLALSIIMIQTKIFLLF
jgi:hypothetical protein